MNKIFLSNQIPEDKTAFSKAKVDVKEILENNGYHTVFFPVIKTPGQLIKFWRSLSVHVNKQTHLVLEYPCRPRRKVWLAAAFAFLKGIKLYGVIHDISDLRFPEEAQKSDMLFLKRFDGLISHNTAMTAWLRKKGYQKPIVNLHVFDYRLTSPKNFNESAVSGKIKVLYAGNLSHVKATYIYEKELGRMNNFELSLYGQYFEKERMNGSRIVYKGVFNPDAPQLPDQYHFGLIWEGTSIDTCQGQYGEYIRFNNPHKFSLYISLGLPVIVWKEAAIAPYVLQNNIGFTIENLRDLNTMAATITTETYRTYVENIQKISGKVREGHFLKTAIEKLAKS